MTIRKPAWLVLCGVLMAAVVLAALLTPLVSALNGWLTTVCPALRHYPADRIFRRLASILGLLSVLYYQWHVRRQSLGELGWRRGPGWLRQTGQGIALGLVMFILLMLMLVASGAAAWRAANGPAALAGMAGFIPAAVCIGLIEETFFRGIVLQTLLRDYSRITAGAATSLLYAVVHFLKEWHTPLAILPDLIGLFLFGLILASAYLRTRLLYLSFGLHTVLAWLVKTDQHVLEYIGREPRWLFGTERLITGAIGWVALLALWAVMWRLTARSQKEATLA